MKKYPENFDGITTDFIYDNESQHQSKLYSFVKRAFDVLISVMALIALAPVFLLISIALFINSRGPTFNRTKRVGKDGRVFSIYKFRTMFISTTRTQAFRNFIDNLSYEKKLPSVSRDLDPRITHVGRFLRRLGLDELPQIYNVLKGDMSFVGPRAAIPFEVEFYQDWYKERFTCRPGVTGYAQVYHSLSETELETLMKMDIYYIRNRSFMFDLRILLRTHMVVLRGNAAY